MSHNLATIGGKTAMAYTGEVPWHGLGRALEKPATAAEAMAAAQLDWEVAKVPLHFKEGGRYRRADNWFGVVRQGETHGKKQPLLGIVGAAYTPLQNRDAFAWFDPIVGQGAAVYHTAGALGDGERVWMLAKLPDDIRVIGDDIAEKYLLLSNSHDGTSSVQIRFTPIRVVCQNTLSMALRAHGGLRISHTPSLAMRLKAADENLGLIRASYQKIAEGFQRLAAVNMNQERLAGYLTDVFPDPNDPTDERAVNRVAHARAVSEKLFAEGCGNREEKVRGTLWAAYNGVTEYIDHRMSATLGADRRLDAIWFGRGYLSKARAFRMALTTAEAARN